jgi:hypothetical protein
LPVSEAWAAGVIEAGKHGWTGDHADEASALHVRLPSDNPSSLTNALTAESWLVYQITISIPAG